MKQYKVFWITLCLALAGCASADRSSTTNGRSILASGGDRLLQIDGQSIVLGDASMRPISRAAFVNRVEKLSAAGMDDEVGRLVWIYPDIAEEAILAAPPAGLRTQQAIAAWLDSLAEPDLGGWVSFVSDRSVNPARYAAYARARASVWPALRSGAFDKVARLSLSPPTDGPTAWPEIDATHLLASASFAAGRATDAARLYERAAKLAEPWDRRVSTRNRLFAALAFQLSGEQEIANRHLQAVLETLEAKSVNDPMTLRLILQLSARWPDPEYRSSRRVAKAHLGELELRRGMPQAALISYRSAEGEAGAEPSTPLLRLRQAEALLALHQDEAAVAILVGLVATEARAEALVILGLVHLTQGKVELGIGMLTESVNSTTPDKHPGVFADVGLAMLALGQPEAGRSFIRQSMKAYSSKGDAVAMRQLLRNKMQYAERVGDHALAQQALRALREVQSPVSY